MRFDPVTITGDLDLEKLNDEELFAQAQTGANRAWDNWAGRDWAGRSVEEINPPAFPTRKNQS